MKPIAFAVAAFALLLPAFAGDKNKKSRDPEGYDWESNYELARLKAAEQGKLLFLNFWFEG